MLRTLKALRLTMTAVATRSFTTAVARPLRIALIGLPGSGKGTQSAWMERDFGLKPISSGQLLRDLSTPKPGVEPSESARAIAATLARGELVSDDLMLRIITEALTNEKVNASGWILDGYPRNVSQAEALQGVLERHRLPLDRVLYIDVPQEEILNRLGGRMVHLASGRVYNLSFNPPKKPGIDDVTGEPLIVREDDKPETIRNRIEKYFQQTTPVLQYYESKGLLTRIPSPSSPEGYAIAAPLLRSLQEQKRAAL